MKRILFTKNSQVGVLKRILKMIELKKLPYEMNSLEPYIDLKTVELHYTKHHQWYVDKLNGLIKWTEFENMNLEEIVLKSNWIIFNNAAQVWNHTFYRDWLIQWWTVPSGKILSKIKLSIILIENLWFSCA